MYARVCVLVCVRVRLPRFIRGDVETVKGRRYGGDHLPVLIYTCASASMCGACVRARVRVDICQRLLRPSVAFPYLNAMPAKAFQIDVEARSRYETEVTDKGKADNLQCN